MPSRLAIVRPFLASLKTISVDRDPRFRDDVTAHKHGPILRRDAA